MTTKTMQEQVDYLKGEIHYLQNIRTMLEEVQAGGSKGVWCCSIDFLPHTAGYCPIHPEAEKITVREALGILNEEIKGNHSKLLSLLMKQQQKDGVTK